MYSNTVLGFLFATATMAAPILESLPVSVPDLPAVPAIPKLPAVPDLPTGDLTKGLSLDKLTKLIPSLPVRRGLVPSLDILKSLPVAVPSTSDLPLDTSSLPLDPSTLTALLPIDALSELPVRRGLVPSLDILKSLPVGVPDLPVDPSTLTSELPLDTVTELIPELPVRRGLVPSLDILKSLPVAVPSLPVDATDLDTSDATGALSELSVDPSTLTSLLPTDVLSELPVRRGLVPTLDILKSIPVAVPELPVDPSSIESLIPTDATSIIPDASALDAVPEISKRLLGLDSLLSKLNSGLTDLFSAGDKVEAELLSLVGHLEDASVTGTLSDVYSILNTVVSKLHALLALADADVDLSSLQPTVSTLTGEFNKIAQDVQNLIDAGLVGNLIEEIKDVVDDVIRLVENLIGQDLSKA